MLSRLLPDYFRDQMALRQDNTIDFTVFESDNDYNGSIMIVHAEGEDYEHPIEHADYVKTYVYRNSHLANDGEDFSATLLTKEEFWDVVHHNYVVMRTVDNTVSEHQLARVAYLKALTVKYRLVSPHFDPNRHHVTYNGCEGVGNHHWMRFETGVQGTSTAGVFSQELVRHLSLDVRNYLKTVFNDLVCAVAYVFRTRGHHYLDSFDALYDRVWRRALHNVNDLNMTWVQISRYAFHAVMPDVLDAFWRHCVEHSYCAGTFIVRYNCACAGTAAIWTTFRGVQDIKLLFPNIFIGMESELEVLDDMIQDMNLSNNRWKGSINSTFYGVVRHRFSDQELGALGAIVRGIYATLAPQEDLLLSESLKRIAKYAPVTGSIMGQAAVKAARSDNFVGALLPNSKG